MELNVASYCFLLRKQTQILFMVSSVVFSSCIECPISPNIFYVILLGQSNARGSNTDSELGSEYNDIPNVFIWSFTGDVYEQINPGTNTNYDPASSGAYYGVETEIAYRFSLERPNDVLYIIKLVQGGTPLAQDASGTDWSPLSTSELDDTYLDSEAPTAISALPGNAKPLGIIWVHGESDATDVTDAGNYAANLSAFITKVRSSFSLTSSTPFLLNILRSDLDGGTFPGLSSVRSAQSGATSNANTITVSSESASLQVDGIHYNSAGILVLADLFYEQLNF